MKSSMKTQKNFSCFVIIHDCHPWLHKYYYKCGQTYHLTKPDINSSTKRVGEKRVAERNNSVKTMFSQNVILNHFSRYGILGPA